MEEQPDSDPIQEMLDAIEHQAREVAKTIRGLKIKVGATTGDDKTFDHFIAFADKSAKIAENIKVLRKMIKGEDEEETEKPRGGPLTSRFGSR